MWPVALGVPAGLPRILWIVIAVACLWVSSFFALKSAKKGEAVTINAEPFPFWLYGLAVLPVLIAGITMPLAIFGDEEAIMLPAFTALSLVARTVGWIPLMIAALAALFVGGTFVRRFPERFLGWFVGGCGVFALVIGLLVARTETEFVRYPPLVHFMQGFATVFTSGDTALFRLPSVLWLFVFGWMIWHMAPWSRVARFLAFFTVMLTPLGWIYKVLLYQSAGEIVFAALAALLIAQLIQIGKKEGSVPLIGMTFTLWIMYRPTALAAAAACCALLFILGYKKAAKDIALIAFPIGFMWVMVYLIGSFQYDFLQPGGGRVWSLASVTTPVIETLRMLPSQLHPVGLLIMLGSTLWLLRAERSRAMPLLIVWYIALVNTALHQLLTTEKWYGYGRFNALLILPLAFSIAGLWGASKIRQIIAGIAVAVLVLVTPWHITGFMQSLRTVPADQVERTVTGGMIPIALPGVTTDLLTKGITPAVILAPSYAFLDIDIARGLLTSAQRTEIRERSATWTPENTARPVLIQAPIRPVHYLGNISKEEEQRLLDAAAWAAAQPGVTIVRYGWEVTYVVGR